MEARLAFLVFTGACVLLFVAGVLLERRRAAGAHKRWLRNLRKQDERQAAEFAQVVENHRKFLDRVKKP